MFSPHTCPCVHYASFCTVNNHTTMGFALSFCVCTPFRICHQLCVCVCVHSCCIYTPVFVQLWHKLRAFYSKTIFQFIPLLRTGQTYKHTERYMVRNGCNKWKAVCSSHSSQHMCALVFCPLSNHTIPDSMSPRFGTFL